MGENSNIEWCDHTFNPWIGCTEVSPGCVNCYAATLDEKRFSKTLGGATKEAPISHWGKGAPRHRTSTWSDPVKWNKAAEGAAVRPRVFCASLADWLDDEVPLEWLVDLLQLIATTPNLDWLLLTKRPQNWAPRVGMALRWIIAHEFMASKVDPAFSRSMILNDPNFAHCLPVLNKDQSTCSAYVNSHAAAMLMLAGWTISHISDEEDTPPPNVWIGTTVEDQRRADARIPELLKIPARVRFLSCEPLLGPVDLTTIPWAEDPIVPGLPRTCLIATATVLNTQGREAIDWVICGGESGKDARPMHPDWASSLRDQCEAAGVPFLFKQWGEWHPESSANYATGKDSFRYGKVEGRAILEDGRCCFRNSKESPAGKSITVDREAADALHASEDWKGIGYQWMQQIGKKSSGRLLDGIEHNGFPVVKEVSRA